MLSIAQAVAPAPDLPVSPADQSLAAYEGEWRAAVRQWRRCAFPRETYRYVRAMADALVQTKAYQAQGLLPDDPVEPEYSSFQAAPQDVCVTLLDGMQPIIAAYDSAQKNPARLRPWSAPSLD